MNNLTNENLKYLDYVKSTDPVVIDQGIRDIIRGVNLSIMAMGIGLARIKSERLYLKLGFKNMFSYIKHICEETKAEFGTMYNYLNIGVTYLKHKDDLEKIGFCENDGPTKLPYLKRALTFEPKEVVFENIKNMSKNEFADYAKSGNPGKNGNMELSEIRGNTVYFDGIKAIIVNKNLSKWETNFIMKAANVLFKARKRRGVIVAVHLRNSKEANLFAIEAERIRAEIQGRRE